MLLVAICFQFNLFYITFKRFSYANKRFLRYNVYQQIIIWFSVFSVLWHASLACFYKSFSWPLCLFEAVKLYTTTVLFSPMPDTKSKFNKGWMWYQNQMLKRIIKETFIFIFFINVFLINKFFFSSRGRRSYFVWGLNFGQQPCL